MTIFQIQSKSNNYGSQNTKSKQNNAGPLFDLICHIVMCIEVRPRNDNCPHCFMS